MSPALPVMGKRNVVPFSTWSVNGETSMPSSANSSCAVSHASVMAGKTTWCSPTTRWHSGEARYLTHCQDASGLSVPAQIESASPLNMLARSPEGPTGVGAMPASRFS